MKVQGRRVRTGLCLEKDEKIMVWLSVTGLIEDVFIEFEKHEFEAAQKLGDENQQEFDHHKGLGILITMSGVGNELMLAGVILKGNYTNIGVYSEQIL